MNMRVRARPSTARVDELEARIRKLGQEIVAVAEEVARAKRTTLQTSVARYRMALLASIVLLALAVIAIGRILSRWWRGR